MMRRRVSAVPAALHSVSRRHQGTQNSDDFRMHKFVRENQPSSSRDFARNKGGSGGGGRGFNQGERGPATPAGAGVTHDWAARLQQELYGEVDPLGGQLHKDYYRDPAKGYTPQYAPRNFASGGEIGYSHTLDGSVQYAAASAERTFQEHDVSKLQQEAQGRRHTLRGLASQAERERYITNQIPADRFASHIPTSESTAILDQLHNSGVLSGESRRSQSVLDRFSATAPTTPSAVAGTLARDELDSTLRDQFGKLNDDFLDEHMRLAMGLRAKERFEFQIRQRSTKMRFDGYDKDRTKAQQRGTPPGATQLPPNMAAASMEEAQRDLRRNGVPSSEAKIRERFSENTVSDEPKLGEALTQDVVGSVNAAKRAQANKAERERKQRLGLGRQGTLVQDGGPDKRQLKRHTNDERIMDAMIFASDAYRKTITDEHKNPYLRGDTAKGVGHLLRNQFDIQRREDRIAKGEKDLTELNMIHYGVPVQQTLDEFVLRHRNARGERPLDFFTPFPDFRALRLYQVFEDTEGFSLMRQRPEFLEWELFTRYRAHHQQRRELALLHGLEPVANETAQERDARRLKLDILCEQTPFDPSKLSLQDDQKEVDAETLRRWFGVYMLPSPTVVQAVISTPTTMGLYGQHMKDELGVEDRREHLLSSRYINKLLLFEGYLHRVHRGSAVDVSGSAPQPVVPFAQPTEVLKYFSREEQIMYNDYVKSETEKQLDEWKRIKQGRRYLPHKEQYAEVISQGSTVEVMDVRGENGEIVTVATKAFEKVIDDIVNKGAQNSMTVDGKKGYQLVLGSKRVIVPLTVKLEYGEVLETTDEDFSQYPLEEAASTKYNHNLDHGVAAYAYNRGNYVETQDVLWERGTAAGTEGWSPATHADNLRAGLPVRARRSLATASTQPNHPTTAGASEEPRHLVGDFQHARVVNYFPQPFFNPGERRVTVEFVDDGKVEEVFLHDTQIWQRRYHGPDRTAGEETRKYNPANVRRYVDVTDPDHTRERGTPKDHFLDKYNVHNPEVAAAKQRKLRSTKQITEIDDWTPFDTKRADNYRPLSISHRKDYIRRGYIPHFTPWEWIAVQEADQPIIKESIRSDDTGSSHFFSLNRYWRYKARPHGYIRNYENEVRDLFQFVDGVTPWKQAQKIRTYWEVREHHPMPQFNRPQVAMHRNTAGLLPAHLWETDKKTGKVKGVKDSVREYQTKTPIPNWVQL